MKSISHSLFNFIGLTLLFASATAFSSTLPNDAITAIHQVNKAAKSANFANLKSLMVQNFIWSFGGDASATQSIEDWKANPDNLKRLIEATEQPCVLLSDNTVECPSAAGLGYRAGFKRTSTGWRMFYFVQGD